MSAPFLGTFQTTLIAEPTSDGFRANTRPGAAWSLIGGVEGFLGPIFLPYLFPGGVILSWSSGLPAPDQPGEGWLGPGGLRRFGVRTQTESPDGPIRLLLPDGRTIALMTLSPAPSEPLHDDYAAVVDQMEAVLRTKLFVAPRPGQSVPPPGLDAYLRQMHSSARVAQDDLEFVFGAAVAARNSLKFLPIPLRELDPGALSAFGTLTESDLATVRWSIDEQSRIATIKAEAFLGAADVDRAFESALLELPSGLVIDLRACPGVELSSLRVLAWLTDSAVDGGTFFGPAGGSPSDAIELANPDDFDEAGPRLDERGAIRLVVQPVASPYLGPVAVLTDRRTAGSAEALVALLKDSGRAKTFGEATAGRIVLSRPFDIGQGWILRMPAAGWRPPPTVTARAKGIEPDVRTGRDAAPTRAAEGLNFPKAR